MRRHVSSLIQRPHQHVRPPSPAPPRYRGGTRPPPRAACACVPPVRVDPGPGRRTGQPVRPALARECPGPGPGPGPDRYRAHPGLRHSGRTAGGRAHALRQGLGRAAGLYARAGARSAKPGPAGQPCAGRGADPPAGGLGPGGRDLGQRRLYAAPLAGIACVLDSACRLSRGRHHAGRGARHRQGRGRQRHGRHGRLHRDRSQQHGHGPGPVAGARRRSR